jgi:hypothetical protein
MLAHAESDRERREREWTHPGWPIGILLVMLSVFFLALMSEINNLVPEGGLRLIIPSIGTVLSLFAVLLYAYRAYHRNQGGWVWGLCARYCACLGFCCRAVDGVFAREGYQTVSENVPTLEPLREIAVMSPMTNSPPPATISSSTAVVVSTTTPASTRAVPPAAKSNETPRAAASASAKPKIEPSHTKSDSAKPSPSKLPPPRTHAKNPRPADSDSETDSDSAK